MEPFTHFQNINEVNNSDSVFGGIFTNNSTLDTAIGLRHDTDIGQINSLFDDIKKKEDEVQAESEKSSDPPLRNKRDVDTSGSASSASGSASGSPSDSTVGNTGNSTIWTIVGVIVGVIIILLIIFFVLRRMNKRKSLMERAKTMYSNISNKLSTLHSNTKNTMIDEE